MAVSLEIRLPLVDQVVVEQVNRPERFDPFWAGSSKQLLREIGLEGLDPKLFERPTPDSCCRLTDGSGNGSVPDELPDAR